MADYGTSGTAGNPPTVEDLMRKYLSGLNEQQRVAQQTELNRFVRWLKPGAVLDELKAEDVERYQEQFERTGADSLRLEPIRTFLAAAHKQGHSGFNLGKFVKIKRSSKKAAAAAKVEDPTPVTEETTHITREGYDGLKKELEFLTSTKRAEIAHELSEARMDKDFRENAPFDAAKQHQAEVENRIRFLERILAVAEIVDHSSNGNRVGLGTTVVLRDMTHNEELSYTLVGTSEANPRLGRISIVSPVGKAMIDRAIGEEFEVEAPAGKIIYRIESFEG
jgi:transcription elongation factor GreA